MGKTAMFILVGYVDIRYHIETVIFVFFIFIMVVEGLGIRIKKKSFIGVIALIGLVFTIFRFRYVGYGTFLDGYSDVLSKIEEEPEWVTELNEELCAEIKDKSSEILTLGFSGYEFGSWTDWKIYASPESNQWEKIEYALNNYMDVEYIVITKEYSNPDVIRQLSQIYEKTDLTEYYLFDLETTK
jgi:hypothetical protein